VSDISDDSGSQTLPGADSQPTLEPSEPEDLATVRFKSCRWHATNERKAAYCSHGDVLPYAGMNGFKAGAWCLDCTFFKVRRSVKRRDAKMFDY